MKNDQSCFCLLISALRLSEMEELWADCLIYAATYLTPCKSAGQEKHEGRRDKRGRERMKIEFETIIFLAFIFQKPWN